MQAEASVDEAEIGQIRPETPATFKGRRLPRRDFTRAVSQIRKAPQVVQNVVTYTVVVAVANPSGRLLPDMTASVRFVTAQRANVLKVPNMALRFRPPDGAAARPEGAPGAGSAAPRAPAEKRPRSGGATAGRVWVLGRDGQPAPAPVTLGITDGTSTEIVRGELAAGQAVLIGLEAESTATPSVGGPGLRL